MSTAVPGGRWSAQAVAGAALCIALLGLGLRIGMLDLNNADLVDHFIPWLEDIRQRGFWTALGTPFSAYGYTPFYSYCLGLANQVFPDGTDGKIVIKSVSILFDYIAAALVAMIVWQEKHDQQRALMAFAAILLAPTVLLNGAAWGQSDIVYTSFLLLCLYAALAQRPLLVMLSFGLALSIKLQAAWLGPFILMLLLRARLRWWMVALVPLCYLLVALPAIFAGRSVLEVSTVYLTQAGTQKALNASAANLQFFSHYFFTHKGLWPEIVPLFAKLSVLFTAVVALVYAWRSARLRLEHEALVLAALVSVMLLPMFLPFMHNRYFFAADILSIVLALMRRSFWPVAVLIQLTSLVTYISFLSPGMEKWPVPEWIAMFGFTNNLQPITALIALAGLLNLAILIACWRRMEHEERDSSSSRAGLSMLAPTC